MANPRIEELRKRLEKEPGSRLFAQLAEELRKEGELAEAIQVCRDGLQKQPNYPSAHMTLGRALFDSGELAAARSELEAVVRGSPDNILASRLLGECLERLGDGPAALQRYKMALALAPGDRVLTAKVEALALGGRSPRAVDPAAATVMMPSPVPARAAPPPPPAPQAGERQVQPEPLSEPEPPPIPVSQVDEPFEIERPFEARPTVVGNAPPAAQRQAPPMPPSVSEPEPAPATGDEDLDLERAYEAGPSATGAPPAWSAEPPGAPSQPAADEGAVTSFDSELAREETPEPPPPPMFAPKFTSPEATPTAPPPAPPSRPAAPGPELQSAPPAAGMNTATLAELYFSQGVMDKAIQVYRQLLEREPGNERARTRLEEIESLDRQLREEEVRAVAEGEAGGAGGPQAARRAAIERTIARLEELLSALRRS